MVFGYQQGSTQNSVCVSTEKTPLCASSEERPHCFKFCKSCLFFSLYVVCYVIYLISGAAVFNMLETPEEEALIQRLKMVRQKFLTDHPSVTDEVLQTFLNEIVRASKRGVTLTQNGTEWDLNWSFGQSFFFSSTVITTIGYGQVTPLSHTGKIFCVVYAIIGIPMTLVLLSALSDRLLVPTVWFLQYLNSRLGHLYKPLNIRLLHLLIIASFVIIFLMLLPAVIFTHLEPEWDYLDSLYYCFISLTTIGLGDYVPGDAIHQPHRRIYKLATTVYLFVGLTFMMMVLSVFYDIPELNIGSLFPVSQNVNSEEVHLAVGMGTLYGLGSRIDMTYDENTHRQVVRVRSRRDNSPSPEETGPKPFRLP